MTCMLRERLRPASFPAPPLPLTEQERLLLRLAHRGDPENMAILNPDAAGGADCQGHGTVSAIF